MDNWTITVILYSDLMQIFFIQCSVPITVVRDSVSHYCYGYRFRDDLWVCKENNDNNNNSIAGRHRAIGDGSQHLIDRPSRGGRAHIQGRPGSAEGGTYSCARELEKHDWSMTYPLVYIM